MRILFTLHDFLPRVRAGSELYTYYLAKALLAEGHAVHVLHAEPGEQFASVEGDVDGLPCTVIQKPLPRGAARNLDGVDARVDSLFSNVLGTFQPNVLHVNHLLHLSTNLPGIARRCGIPTVFTLHDYWLACARIDLLQFGRSLCTSSAADKCADCCRQLFGYWPKWEHDGGLRNRLADRTKDVLFSATHKRALAGKFARRFSRMGELIRNVDLFIAPSRFLMDFMCREGIPQSKIVYCDHGMHSALFDKRPYRPLRKERLTFGYVGTISAHKGVDVLLKAFDGFFEADLHIYGKASDAIFGPHGHVLRQPNVHFKGMLLDEDKAAAFESLDALIVPSVWYENSPLTIHEAYLAGIPVVTSDIGGMAELVPHGVSGLQFRTGDPGSLREALCRLCQAPQTLDALRANIPHVKSMEEHVPEVLGFYDMAMRQMPAPADKAAVA